MNDEKYWRQLELYDPQDLKHHVLVVGAGSIGSYTVFALARMGVQSISVVDFDKVEQHNLPNQFFSENVESTGIPKVDVLKTTVGLILKETNIITHNDKIENILLTKRNVNLVAVTVDNMKTREFIHYANKESAIARWVIDARVGGQNMNLFIVDYKSKDSIEYYESTLYSDEEAVQLPCTARSVVDLSLQVAGAIATATRLILNNSVPPVTHVAYDYKTLQAYPMITKKGGK